MSSMTDWEIIPARRQHNPFVAHDGACIRVDRDGLTISKTLADLMAIGHKTPCIVAINTRTGHVGVKVATTPDQQQASYSAGRPTTGCATVGGSAVSRRIDPLYYGHIYRVTMNGDSIASFDLLSPIDQ